jgi:alpha-ribazole phosphatase
MTSVYLIRHAEPESIGAGRRFVGQSDPSLSAPGTRQAHVLADRLRQVRFDSVYSSDLQRCLMTAEIVTGEAGLPVRQERRLREIDVGLWEGLSFEEVRRRYPREHAEREEDLVGYRFPGGESFRDVQRRVVPAFVSIMDGGAENVLVVGHKGVNRVLLAHFLGLPLEELFSIAQDYCCVNIIRASALPDGSRRIVVERPSWRSGMGIEPTLDGTTAQHRF